MKALGRFVGVLTACVIGFISAVCWFTGCLYLTPLIKPMGFGKRILSLAFTWLVGFITFKIAQFGYRLYRKNKKINPVVAVETTQEREPEPMPKESFECGNSTAPEKNTDQESQASPERKTVSENNSTQKRDNDNIMNSTNIFSSEYKIPSAQSVNTGKVIRLYSMWERTILYCDGWYILDDGKGNCSVISKETARGLELGYVSYQASQDINRGGLPDDVAYKSRGLKQIYNEKGYFERFELVNGYCVDKIYGTPVEMKGVLTIPDIIGGKHINQVCDGAFENCKGLEKVILPAGIKSIGRKAFYGCSDLNEVVTPGGINRIGEGAFEGTLVFSSEEEVYIKDHTLVKVSSSLSGQFVVPKEVTVIAERAFEGCEKLKEIIVHDGVTNIGMSAFHKCTGLENIVLPSKINELGAGAFNGCSSLTKVTVPMGVKTLAHFYDCTSLSEVVIPDSVEKIRSDCFKNTKLIKDFLESKSDKLEIGKWLIVYDVNGAGELTVSEGITGIADQDGFSHSHYLNSPKFDRLTTINLPSTLLYIGADAFSYTGIKSIKLPDRLLSIDFNVFRGTKLERIVIPESVISIDNWAFMDCSSLECITFLGKTNPIWPAITGRRDGKHITIEARRNSPAHGYVERYGEKYLLDFKELR